MKNKLYLLPILVILFVIIVKCAKDSPTEDTTQLESSSITLFDEVLYYDGYAETVNEPVHDGIIRVSNSKYVTKIPDSFISSANNKLDMTITLRAACDNYDRIGNVFLSFMNKGDSYDASNVVDKIEIARFITPFMDKNKTPAEVPYNFEIENVAKLFNDISFTNKYDFWMELDIFGVPYAANKQIAGCEGKNYTFYGTLKLTTDDQPSEDKSQALFPIASFISFNNYKDTDVNGKTIKSFTVEITAPVKNAKIYLITSNHGANTNGEEYNRRDHYIYFDGNLLDVYKPGGKSCEPYRQYNTQSNGIYGRSARTDSEWASFSNWCPGDRIPTRIYDLGNLEQGNHTFKIEVPDAKFADAQGDIPLSAYIQGDK